MQSKKTDDRLYLRTLSDASSLPLLVDTRASQSLQPIHLPTKLRGRIERAQRRANAAKDGVSIFATDPKNAMAISPAVAVKGRSSTAPVADGAVVLALGDTDERPRASTAMGSPGANMSAEKMHLPDVVLSHKMRDFEARANTGGIAALLPAEPADRTLQKLPLEDRERVMLVMQNKIRQIASDVEANFARIAKALDANGIFDTSANIQRAQTLCLVDLQRRCRLDRLRDEAMLEVLQHPSSSISSQKRQSVNPSRKLSQLLKPPAHAKFDDAETLVTNQVSLTRKKRKPMCDSKRLPGLHSTSKTLRKKDNQSSQVLASTDEQNVPDLNCEMRPSSGKMLSRRGGLASFASSKQLVPREDNPIHAITGSSEGDMYSRHPHVTQVLQLLAAGSGTNKMNNTTNSNSAEADMEHARVLDPVDEWIQRSASYQAVGARATEGLRRRAERQRWDTLGHFDSNGGFRGSGCISVAVRQRLDGQQTSWNKSLDTPRSDDGNDVNGVRDVEQGSTNQQELDKEAYAELQSQIRERLRTNERRTRTAAAAMRMTGARGRARPLLAPQTAPSKMVTMSNSTVSLPSSGNCRENQQQQSLYQSSTELGMSASEPVLHIITSTEVVSNLGSGMESSTPLRLSLPGSRGRMSILEQRLLEDSSHPVSRHGRRKGSLIGAPHRLVGNKALGHYSEARIAYRRDSAQTWAWHVSPSTTSCSPVDPIVEEIEECSESKDRFDAKDHDHIDGEGNNEDDEEGNDGNEGGDDDLESIDSSHPPFSARSSVSMSSVKQHVSNNSRKRGKKRVPATGLRRSSRGSSRSLHTGTALLGNALTLHARLEGVWRVLQFPFSHKLAMSDRLSSLPDADAFLSVLEHWERVTPLVAIRQRMRLALSGFAERGELQDNEWLTSSEFALVLSLPQPLVTSATVSTADPTHLKASSYQLDNMSASTFIDWIHDHFDAVTLQTQKLAHELKVNTGDELQFQGYPYPRHE